MAREILFTIRKDGKVEMDLEGFLGSGCSDVTNELVKALGEKVEGSKKCEYYVSAPAKKTSYTHGNG